MQLDEWMVKPTQQTEWIEGRGIILWLAFFFIELGAGIFFVGTFFDWKISLPTTNDQSLAVRLSALLTWLYRIFSCSLVLHALLNNPLHQVQQVSLPMLK